ncbi:MAG: EAL domain-containing protein, partial [Clostridia bacterium]
MNSTTYAKRTTYKPIDFFFRAVVDIKSKKIEFVDAFQILNDRYLGRMSVCNYFFIAENSVRINELNVIALDELKAYHLVMRENFMIPEKVVYSLPITTRFLENDKEFDILVSTLQENGYKKSEIVLTFDCNTLQELGEDGAKLYARLRKLGFKTCVYGFGEQFNSLDIFAKYKFDYLRMEASYFTATDSKKRLLNMLVKFCATNKIKLIMEGVDTPSQKTRFKREGVKLVTG